MLSEHVQTCKRYKRQRREIGKCGLQSEEGQGVMECFGCGRIVGGGFPSLLIHFIICDKALEKDEKRTSIPKSMVAHNVNQYAANSNVQLHCQGCSEIFRNLSEYAVHKEACNTIYIKGNEAAIYEKENAVIPNSPNVKSLVGSDIYNGFSSAIRLSIEDTELVQIVRPLIRKRKLEFQLSHIPSSDSIFRSSDDLDPSIKHCKVVLKKLEISNDKTCSSASPKAFQVFTKIMPKPKPKRDLNKDLMIKKIFPISHNSSQNATYHNVQRRKTSYSSLQDSVTNDNALNISEDATYHNVQRRKTSHLSLQDSVTIDNALNISEDATYHNVQRRKTSHSSLQNSVTNDNALNISEDATYHNIQNKKTSQSSLQDSVTNDNALDIFEGDHDKQTSYIPLNIRNKLISGHQKFLDADEAFLKEFLSISPVVTMKKLNSDERFLKEFLSISPVVILKRLDKKNILDHTGTTGIIKNTPPAAIDETAERDKIVNESGGECPNKTRNTDTILSQKRIKYQIEHNPRHENGLQKTDKYLCVSLVDILAPKLALERLTLKMPRVKIYHGAIPQNFMKIDPLPLPPTFDLKYIELNKDDGLKEFRTSANKSSDSQVSLEMYPSDDYLVGVTECDAWVHKSIESQNANTQFSTPSRLDSNQKFIDNNNFYKILDSREITIECTNESASEDEEEIHA